jgi:pilus assembly protein CpaF
MPPAVEELAEVRRDLHDALVSRLDVRGLHEMSRAERRMRVREEALSVLRHRGHMLPQRSLAAVISDVSDEVVGFGAIEFLLKDPDVTEVMVDGQTMCC